MSQLDEVERAVRTALRCLDAAHTASQELTDTNQHLAAAIQQIAVAVQKLAELMRESPLGHGREEAVQPGI
jgi:methyl-accepting chemotaxis protein